MHACVCGRRGGGGGTHEYCALSKRKSVSKRKNVSKKENVTFQSVYVCMHVHVYRYG